MENVEQAQKFTFFEMQPAIAAGVRARAKPHPLRLPQASTQEAEKGCHTLKTNPVQQSPDMGINATSAEEDDRLLPPLGSPGCTLGNPASPPTPRELIRKILLLGSSNLQWRGSQARLRLWTCPVMFRLEGGLALPGSLQCNPEF